MTTGAIFMETVYFVDFDHTISKKDVWDAIARMSDPVAWRNMIDRYIAGELKSQDCNRMLAELVQTTEPEARKVVMSIGIDPTFHDFVAFAKEQNSPLLIVSDGYDYYIEMLLKEEGLEFLEYYCNKMQWTENGVKVEFPLNREDCENSMAHCKCQHIKARTGTRRVYIGDGISDICASQKCEVVYAKRNLLEFFQNKGLPHQPFDTFLDIIECEKRSKLDEQPLAHAE
jgi:2,3-diketo-5-methylthio-1-phosphopentane phosphatase